MEKLLSDFSDPYKQKTYVPLSTNEGIYNALMSRFQSHVTFKKADIQHPYVINMQTVKNGQKKPKKRCCFFSFQTPQQLIAFFHFYSHFQRERNPGFFAMECFFTAKLRKWILDIDGNIETLHAAGLCASNEFCTLHEVQAIKQASLQYITEIASFLGQIHFISRDHIYCTIVQRHRPRDAETFSKLSFHLTLHVLATQAQWTAAWNFVDRKTTSPIKSVDDVAVKRNKVGQNISILHSSKPVTTENEANPIFTFDATYKISPAAQTQKQCFAKESTSNPIVQYAFSSGLFADFLCETVQDSWQMAIQNVPKKRDIPQNDCREPKKIKKDEKMAQENMPTITDIPEYVQKLLGPCTELSLNFTMPSLKELPNKIFIPPTCTKEDMKCVKIENEVCAVPMAVCSCWHLLDNWMPAALLSPTSLERQTGTSQTY